MTRQSSFSKLRKEMMPGFREKMQMAESTEDVKKFYADTMRMLLDRLASHYDPIMPEDIQLSPESTDGYFINPEIMDRPPLRAAWNESDLPYILDDFTTKALNRYAHLSKNPEKDRSKIYHLDGKR